LAFVLVFITITRVATILAVPTIVELLSITEKIIRVGGRRLGLGLDGVIGRKFPVSFPALSRNVGGEPFESDQQLPWRIGTTCPDVIQW
jgi:hypothetical protein